MAPFPLPPHSFLSPSFVSAQLENVKEGRLSQGAKKKELCLPSMQGGGSGRRDIVVLLPPGLLCSRVEVFSFFVPS